MLNIPSDWLDEITNIEMSKRLRWADKLKVAGEYDLAEVVFPDMPDLDFAEINRRNALKSNTELERNAA
jgi:hypothetical protein